ncbi:MAG TPA: dTDP-4-dehydrorhamnose 3,5-epimerase family protein [Steroidobacteraceae bacterium]|nr:dTDP-4-dehydrorhamnose 3,5-epimerase family protein [Steroidobacteraceae bacterium]
MHIEGLLLTPLGIIEDERGAVLHMLRSDAPEFTRFGECYFSEVNPGAIKAWKRHRVQTQNLAVPVGRIRVAVYDARPDSRSHGHWEVIEMGRPDAYARLSIPPQLWYGFMGLGTAAALVANCADAPHDPGESESLAPGALDAQALELLRVGCRAP